MRGEIGYSLPSNSVFSIENEPDSITPRYPVQKTHATNYKDLNSSSPIDLTTPENVKSSVEYDPRSQYYIFRTKVGDTEIATPFSMSHSEYMDFTLKQSMSKYFKARNSEQAEEKDDGNEFSLKNIKLNIGAADQLFGPGGIRFKATGYVEAKMGVKLTTDGNPTRSERNRNRMAFDFDEDIQLNVTASVGDKINFDMNYDTQSMFDFDSKRIKLAYDATAAGDDDAILRKIEAGNVSMSTTNSLIRGNSALFGITTELQFGKLRINSVISQQESEARSVNTRGGVQKMTYEFKADRYDENRHFFVGHYFRDNYDVAMSKLPLVLSPVNITKIEVWVTNKRSDFSQSRNIVAFADIAENKVIKNPARWRPAGTVSTPSNEGNTLFPTITKSYTAARDISQVTSLFTGLQLEGSLDYEKVENARLLTTSEYNFNPQLGYISLTSALQADEVLAVSYSYTMGGKSYQVGEFSSDIVDKYTPGNDRSGALFVKLLKPVSMSPRAYTWDLMMKNVYNLGVTAVQKENFRLDISYQSDTLGTYINYLPDGDIKNQLLLRVMNLDRLDAREQTHPDGVFDFMEGYTITSQNGRIYFPVVEPFGKHLRKKINNTAVADKYVYQELYDSTLTVARQIAEKNKFMIKGSYRGSASDSEINLNATNIPPGSVVVTAGGQKLQENVDYTVDYTSGTVKILNPALMDSNTPIETSLEGRTFSMQRKTLLGVNLSYDFSKNLTLGGTLMHYYEKPMTNKAVIGNESVKNTLWGLNTAYRTESQWLTNMIDKIPFVNATQPSQISLSAEFAQMLPGHYQNSEMGGYSYLDDFETSEAKIDVKSPYAWTLAATPLGARDDANTVMFPEATLSNNIKYGENRAKLAWFIIDPIFTRKNSSLTPLHIKNDKEQLSNHFVREVLLRELYPNRDIAYNEAATIPTLNLSYYPEERGPYNLDAANVSPEGKLLFPEKRWGGITRKMDIRDFESSNVEYIEFWLMDPFVYNGTVPNPNEGGELYFNLGEISEDVLKDGKKFYENGLPTDGDLTTVEETVWGRVPKRQSTVYAFDDNAGTNARKLQDVGLNGLSTEDEFKFGTYVDYLAKLRAKLSGTGLQNLRDDRTSALNDPAGDTYYFYRGADFDREEKSILERYKSYNNTEGNSPATKDTSEKYSTAARSVPDVEDIDQDNTLNETEAYFQYKIDLRPSKMVVGENFIVDRRDVKVPLRNGTTGEVTWYQFKVPVRGYDKRIGNIQDFKSIRFMRMFLTKFKQNTFLRFGTMQLVRGEWRVYEQALAANNAKGNGTIDITTVNIEENSEREPVNYVLPPGLSRDLDPDQTQLTKENEQSLAMKLLNLDPEDARAIYKNTNYDFRKYKKMQLFTHLEELINDTELIQGDLTVFIRLGSDYKHNYYEYEIPLAVTPRGRYSLMNNADRQMVWPKSNMFDFRLENLKDTKLERNREKRRGQAGISFTSLYSKYDPDNNNNKISVMGNPSLSEVSVIMIGVRNNTRVTKSGEVWINELRLTDFDEEGGWAAQANLNVALSDVATVSLSGRKETVGFGGLEQSLMERRQDDYTSYNVATSVDLGRFVPEKAKLSVPFNFAYSNQTTSPQYDPFDQDVTLKESLSTVITKSEKDSIKNLARERHISKSLSFTNVKLNIASKTPMPYDPANFSFGYGVNKTQTNAPSVTYDNTEDYRANMNYSYSPLMKTWEPFKGVKSKSATAKFGRAIGFNYLPSNISFNSNMTRFYTETVLRDIESFQLGVSNENKEFLTWSQSFYWDRDFSINWDITRNLKTSFQSGTRAEIEEPYLQVNKKANRNDYEVWRDSVQRSILHLGTPLSYKQSASATYQLPFRNIPALNWITNSTISYKSGYNWDRGARIDTLELGNMINNNITLDFNNRFNLVNLYNKSGFLKRANERFDGRKRTQTSPRQKAADQKKTVGRFKQEVILRTDTTVTIKHNLKSKKINILAFSNKRKYNLKFKKVDDNTIVITNKDTATIALNIETKQPSEMPKVLEDIGMYTARGLMSVRSVQVNYSRRNETYISGFRPTIGDIFGQKGSDFGYAPGLGFAFGLQGGEEYIDKSLRQNWLVMNETNITPAIFNRTEKLELKAELEPFKGLKIGLNAGREKNDRTEVQYMFEGSPRTYGGSFSITTISLASSFKKSKASENYRSETFEKFLNNRQHIKNRLEQGYKQTVYPNGGFMNDFPGLIGQEYNASVSQVDPNSSDVLIPAFIAAYTGKDVNKVSLSAFPSLSSILPNWSIMYDGLANLPFLKEKVKTLQLLHSYQSMYQVGGYNSFSSWIHANDDMGYIRDVLTGRPVPSSAYDIGSVSINEAFNPLFGINGTLNNNLSLNAQYNKNRILNLNMSAYQIVESLQSEIIVGAGYRINEFNKIIGIKTKRDDNFNNDLNIKADISKRTSYALIRKIEDRYTQATSGTTVVTIMISADYSMSRVLTLRAFFDRVLNKPLVSAASYPTTNTNIGISLKYVFL